MYLFISTRPSNESLHILTATAGWRRHAPFQEPNVRGKACTTRRSKAKGAYHLHTWTSTDRNCKSESDSDGAMDGS